MPGGYEIVSALQLFLQPMYVKKYTATFCDITHVSSVMCHSIAFAYVIRQSKYGVVIGDGRHRRDVHGI